MSSFSLSRHHLFQKCIDQENVFCGENERSSEQWHQRELHERERCASCECEDSCECEPCQTEEPQAEMERQTLRDVQKNTQPHQSHSGRDETHSQPRETHDCSIHW